MKNNNFKINYGNGVTVIPEKAASLIMSGKASHNDIKVLLCLVSNGENTLFNIGLKSDALERSLEFWAANGVVISAVTEDSAQSEALQDETAQDTSAPSAEEKTEPAQKKLLSRDMPKYSGKEISEMIDADGGRLRDMLDACQQLIGHIFTPHETSVMVGLHSWLGLSPDYIVTLVAYYAEKKPGCNVHYIEKAAVDLVNTGIDTSEALDAYLRDMELFDGAVGKLRTVLGVGARAFTKKENGMINRWIKDFGYDTEVIILAYEACCDGTGSFNFDYTNKVLENWYKEGVKTVADARESEAAFKKAKSERTAEKESKENKGSFDTDKFFDLAIKRTYQKMTKKDN